MKLRNMSMCGGYNGGSGYRSGSYAVGTAVEKEYSFRCGDKGQQRLPLVLSRAESNAGWFVGTKAYGWRSFLCCCSYGRSEPQARLADPGYALSTISNGLWALWNILAALQSHTFGTAGDETYDTC